MGSCFVEHTFLAETADDAYAQAEEKGNLEYGCDAYSGYINSCEFMGVKKRYAGKVTAKNVAEAYEIAHNDESCNKWQCRAIDLGIDHYEVIRPKIVKNYKKAKARFLADFGGGFTKQYDTLAEAKAGALKQTLNSGELTTVHKSYVDEETGDENLFKVMPVIKKYNKPPKNVPKGCRLREIHQFYLYGWPGI